MTLIELLGDKAAALSSDLFGEATVQAVESLLLDKNGKTYIKCLSRNKDKPNKHSSTPWGLKTGNRPSHYPTPAAPPASSPPGGWTLNINSPVMRP